MKDPEGTEAPASWRRGDPRLRLNGKRPALAPEAHHPTRDRKLGTPYRRIIPTLPQRRGREVLLTASIYGSLRGLNAHACAYQVRHPPTPQPLSRPRIFFTRILDPWGGEGAAESGRGGG